MPSKTILTPANIRFIKKNRKEMSGADMARRFGVRKAVVNSYMFKHGLSVSKKLQKKFRQGARGIITSATKKEDAILRKYYLLLPEKNIAARIHRSHTFVRTRLRQLELIKPAEIIAKFVKDSRIKPGNIPMNKGLKQSDYMSREAIRKCRKTQFKKGAINHNSLYDGAITLRRTMPYKGSKPHKYIRIKKGVWKELQIYNWEKKHGPVPQGYILACKDGNTLNYRLSNWKLMTKKENMLRNSGSLRLTDGFVAYSMVGKNNMHLYPEVLKNKRLIELKRQQITIKRMIDEQQKVS